MCTPGRCSWALFKNCLRPLCFSLHSWCLKSFLFWRLSIRYRSCFFHSCIFHSRIFSAPFSSSSSSKICGSSCGEPWLNDRGSQTAQNYWAPNFTCNLKHCWNSHSKHSPIWQSRALNPASSLSITLKPAPQLITLPDAENKLSTAAV